MTNLQQKHDPSVRSFGYLDWVVLDAHANAQASTILDALRYAAQEHHPSSSPAPTLVVNHDEYVALADVLENGDKKVQREGVAYFVTVTLGGWVVMLTTRPDDDTSVHNHLTLSHGGEEVLRLEPNPKVNDIRRLYNELIGEWPH